MAPHVLRRIRLPYLWIRETLTNFLFDRRFGTRTSGVVELAELGLASEERVEYKPSGLLFLRRILPPREVNERDVFLDYGAGMGRVILQAAQYPFRRVIGVELSEQLAQTARENIERNAERLRCKDVTVVCSDAVEYEPPDDVTVVYLYNPFTGSIFARVLTKLIESVDRAPRMVRIIYANPVEEAALLETGRVRHARTARGMRPTPEWSLSNSTRMYLLEPQPTSSRGLEGRSPDTSG
jgi:predicted RNA methylase